MTVNKVVRLGRASRELNVGRSTIVDFLQKKGLEIDDNSNAKLTTEQYDTLAKEFANSASEKLEASSLNIGTKAEEDLTSDTKREVQRTRKKEEERILIKNVGSAAIKTRKGSPQQETKVSQEATKKTVLKGIKVLGKIDLEKKKEEKPVKKDAPKEKKVNPIDTIAPVQEKDVIKGKVEKLQGLKVVSKIDLPLDSKLKKGRPVASSDSRNEVWKKRPRKRISSSPRTRTRSPKYAGPQKVELSEKEIQEQVRSTLAKLSSNQKKGGGAKYRKEKRKVMLKSKDKQILEEQENAKVLKVVEYISAHDLSSLMDVSVNDIISACLNLGMFISINQRLDAEAITIIADEFDYDVHFITASDEEAAEEKQEETDTKDFVPRAPIVTIMGHVDHGKTSLLDCIRNAKVTSQEAGGITQHIGAYSVTTKGDRKITFLDTPGHEAFTAMRARGAKLTDLVIIVIAADDDVMPQTKEAINHAQVAGVPIIIALNKIDKPDANLEKVKESLSQINILVEDWGGKYQCQPVSAKTEEGIDELLEKVLLESDILELKANPNNKASGSVLEASLDKGRGYVATLMVQSGSLQVGDIVLAGSYHGKIKAMFDNEGLKALSAGPSTPIQILGLNGAPQAGEKFRVMESERIAHDIASKREQMLREQSIRSKKHITLDEIGRRLAIGSFKELKIIVKGDFDGSVEALSDSLLKLSSSKIHINIIYKGVGQISESDVLLASASDAIIVGFQVRPSTVAKKLAEKEEIEVRLYSVIYDAIDDVKAAMEGMLDKETEEVIVGNIEVREVFKVSKVGTIAGSMVTNGYVKLKNPMRLIREGIVIYSGEMSSLRRFKEDVAEVKSGYDCGIGIKNFNDMKVGDVVESYEIREVKKQ